ncbi:MULTISPECIES: hypothetical protein [unclassified Rhizobium]|uniref:hypothetical protein n=3 Tax=Rhizobium TaxID=379 RepID=UPI000BD9F31D|nr:MULTISPECIES: hypothetical protein [unclassified Rhizobium]MDH7809519.1 uncharacterized membrane protein HdeD (DUF308 family) [Rhizobium sp. AN67]MDQ4408764.1 hypothetical protein [Rhizobium sp. AN63]SOD50445.1 hypothetical protein SAMN05216595_0172 [Rhizobium sp. AN6A]
MAKNKPRARSGHSEKRSLLSFRFPVLQTLRRIYTMAWWSRTNRFTGPGDWRRVIALGVVLIDFAILGFLSSLVGKLAGYLPGTSSMFGGLLTCIIMLRLSRPAIFLDWTLLGVFQICLGIQVQLGLSDSGVFGAVTFYSGLIACAALLIAIGFNTHVFAGRAWLLAGGICSLIMSIASIAEKLFVGHMGSDNTLLIMLTILGLSIVGMGTSLRSK